MAILTKRHSFESWPTGPAPTVSSCRHPTLSEAAASSVSCNTAARRFVVTEFHQRPLSDTDRRIFRYNALHGLTANKSTTLSAFVPTGKLMPRRFVNTSVLPATYSATRPTIRPSFFSALSSIPPLPSSSYLFPHSIESFW